MKHTLLLASLGLTAFLTGVIWFVQLVHYPIFHKVRPDGFAAFQQAHMQTTGTVVALPMVVELILSGLLLFCQFLPLERWLIWSGFVLVLVIWGVTFLVSVPLHSKLASGGFDVAAINRLVHTNWLRTISWTVRLGILLFLTWQRQPI